jgi:hypothetical protein
MLSVSFGCHAKQPGGIADLDLESAWSRGHSMLARRCAPLSRSRRGIGPQKFGFDSSKERIASGKSGADSPAPVRAKRFRLRVISRKAARRFGLIR